MRSCFANEQKFDTDMTTQSSSVSFTLPEAAKRILYANRWFAKLSSAQQSALLLASRRMLLRDGQLFSAQGQLVRRRRDGFGVLVEGMLKVSSTSPDGREAILSFVRPGQWFGELAVIDGANGIFSALGLRRFW
jgi:CRP-like cAMP-binding protein